MTQAGVAITSIAFGACGLISLGASAALVVRLERLAARVGASEAVLGLVAALAADGPEISSAAAAVVHGRYDVGAGVVLGSNVFNLAVLLGLASVVAGRIWLHRSVIVFAGTMSMWVAAVGVAVMLGLIGPLPGFAAVLVVFVPYVVISAWPQRRGSPIPLPRHWRRFLRRAVRDEERELLPAIHPRRGHWRDALVALVALVGMIAASIIMEQTATTLGGHFGISNLVVGAVVLAAVTSLPNAVAALYLASRGRGSAVLSEALNSNNLNILCGLMIPAVILGLGPATSGGAIISIWYLAMAGACLAAAFVARGLRRGIGVCIVAAYVVFVVVLVAT